MLTSTIDLYSETRSETDLALAADAGRGLLHVLGGLLRLGRLLLGGRGGRRGLLTRALCRLLRLLRRPETGCNMKLRSLLVTYTQGLTEYSLRETSRNGNNFLSG